MDYYSLLPEAVFSPRRRSTSITSISKSVLPAREAVSSVEAASDVAEVDTLTDMPHSPTTITTFCPRSSEILMGGSSR